MGNVYRGLRGPDATEKVVVELAELKNGLAWSRSGVSIGPAERKIIRAFAKSKSTVDELDKFRFLTALLPPTTGLSANKRAKYSLSFRIFKVR